MRSSLAILALSALLFAAAPARAAEYKVIYLNFEPQHLAEGRAEPIVLEDGLLLAGPKELHPAKGCKPLTECRGTFEVPVLGEILDALYRRFGRFNLSGGNCHLFRGWISLRQFKLRLGVFKLGLGLDQGIRVRAALTIIIIFRRQIQEILGVVQVG